MGKTVCIIEDDELVRARLADVLRATGHDVFEADSAERGIELIRTRKADVAVVDILMPDRDGLEAIGQLRRTRPDLRIVAISGGGRVGPQIYLDLARQIGADASLTKPISEADLEAAVTGDAAAPRT
ncbi:response regulator [Caulobacter sp. 17J80-11]|uniref:response regulator n=1 Tax=Caulobacter sp. 17J80-11 TaxID=2763502 RepID=UPI001653C9D2|nr:response regulator [Caulobacter sp. 17J80-11]